MNSPTKPKFQQANPNNLAGAGGANNYIQQLIQQGLSPEEKDIYTRQGTTAINNAYGAGKQKLNELISRNSGATPLGFEASGNAQLLGQKSLGISDLKDKLAMAVRSGKQTGIDLYSKLYQLALGSSEGQNQFNIGMYGYDLNSQLNWKDLLSGLLSGAGKVGAAYASK